jgi:hypothetical protein
MSLPIGASEFKSRLVVERSVRKLCIALNMFAEASAITEMRLATCRRLQESHALSENPTTTQNAVARMTAFSSVDTDRRFNIKLPQSCGHLGKKGKYLGQPCCRITAEL